MPESKSGALTSLAIPLHELAACRHFNVSLLRRQAKFYSTTR
jgi:hypothetical protein